MSKFKIKIKAYDWMPENEFALVYRGLTYEGKPQKTGKIARLEVKKPRGVIVKTQKKK